MNNVTYCHNYVSYTSIKVMNFIKEYSPYYFGWH
jgi:hypothetical protein